MRRHNSYLAIVIIALLCIALWSIGDRRTQPSAPTLKNGGLAVSSKAKDPFAKCTYYTEMRDIDFSQPDIKDKLCKNTVLYEKQQNGKYPVCEIADSVPDALSSLAKKGSVKSFLYGYHKERIPMFVLPPPDYISVSIASSHTWEAGNVNAMLKLALSLSNTTFVDVGCNIGAFTLTAAKAGLPTLSLDANIRNLVRLHMSLQDNGIDPTRSKLIWGFVSRNLSQPQLLSFPSDCNSGGAGIFIRGNFLAQKDKIAVMPMAAEALKNSVTTRRVVMKMDIEMGEADFLLTVGSLFDDLDIAVLMEEWWANNKWAEFLAFKTYLPFSVGKAGLVAVKDATKTPHYSNIVWIKKDYVQQLVYTA